MVIGRFATDSSLDWFARRLRILGYDVIVLPGARLEHVCSRARAEGRVVLTLSTRVPPPCAHVSRFVVTRDDPGSSLRGLAGRFEPDAAPFSRCTACNQPLSPAAGAGDARPEGAPAAARAVRRCPACGKCYWHGSHVDRLLAWLESALGRPVRAPEPPPDVADSGEAI